MNIYESRIWPSQFSLISATVQTILFKNLIAISQVDVFVTLVNMASETLIFMAFLFTIGYVLRPLFSHYTSFWLR